VSEPEDVIIDAAHVATATARSLWLKYSPPAAAPGLCDFRRRLGLFVTMLFPDAPEISAAESPAPRSLLARLASATPAHTLPEAPFPSTDGSRIRLPAVLDDRPPGAALPTYRLLALEQAARAQRGTPVWLPTGDTLVRDLFLLAEAATVDCLLIRLVPGLGEELTAIRRSARISRPRARLTRPETEVEHLLCALLEAPPANPPRGIPRAGTPAESLAWARQQGTRMRSRAGRYRGIAPVFLWGLPAPPIEEAPTQVVEVQAHAPAGSAKASRMRRRPRVRLSAPDEDDPRPGLWLPRADDPQESVEDPMGLQRPSDREEQARADELGDSLAELPEASLVRTPETAPEVLLSDELPPRAAGLTPAERSVGALVYPEWDWRRASYQLKGAVVRERRLPAGDPAWVEGALRRHNPLIRRVRRDFERLRPLRQALRGQLEGSAVDVDAYVVFAADRLAGGTPDGRLYLEERRRRRDTAVLLLIDASASTDAWVAGSRRVIDVAKEGLLIVIEALAALGDRHAVFAFRGEGPERVDLLAVKRFEEAAGEPIKRRVAALEPNGYTRLGAALRHGTALLSRESTRHRLLLLLSDGRPNDVDVYEGRYGLEDTRQALAEARVQGVKPFCLTIDREAPRYAARVFGNRDYAVLRQPERMPEVLVTVLRQLLR
jgi:nitric oxide reductase NorD protein